MEFGSDPIAMTAIPVTEPYQCPNLVEPGSCTLQANDEDMDDN
jgi:hypothetical protein